MIYSISQIAHGPLLLTAQVWKAQHKNLSCSQ